MPSPLPGRGHNAAWACRLVADVSRRDPDHALGADRGSRSRSRPPFLSRRPSSRSSRWRCSRRRTSGSTSSNTCCRASLLDTALLLGGVGALSLAIGTGAAWAISLHEFRGRQMLLWLVPLPLAIPTYLAAYVYVDLFEPLGPGPSARSRFGCRCRTRCACFPTCARCPAPSS